MTWLTHHFYKAVLIPRSGHETRRDLRWCVNWRVRPTRPILSQQVSISSSNGLDSQATPNYTSHCHQENSSVLSCMILHDSTWFNVILRDSTWFYMILHDSTWFYTILRDSMWFYTILRDSTWFYMILHDSTWFYMILHSNPNLNTMEEHRLCPGEPKGCTFCFFALALHSWIK